MTSPTRSNQKGPGPASSDPWVTFFTKPDCSLCGSALFIVERVRARIPFDLEIVDIAAPGHEDWFAAYRHDIPVVHINGTEVARHRVVERQFFDELMRVQRNAQELL